MSATGAAGAAHRSARDVLRPTKRYGDREALRPLTLTLSAGELTALIGPNGAGKTTLLSILAGAIPPERRSRQPPPARGRLGAPADRAVRPG